MPAFEQEQGESDIAKLNKFIAKVAEEYRSEGIPVGYDGRIDEAANTRARADSYFDIPKEAGKSEAERFGIAAERKPEKMGPSEDEKLDMLSYAIFVKNLDDKFVVARSSQYDSMNNNASIIILERETGNLVCAFNEVAEVGTDRYKRRADFVHDLNLRKGTSLKYGIGSEMNGGERKITLGPVENIPVFYLALPSSQLKGGMKEFVPEAGNQSEFERKLFLFFLASINAQIKGLEINEDRLNPTVKNRMAAFKKVIESQENKKELQSLKKLAK